MEMEPQVLPPEVEAQRAQDAPEQMPPPDTTGIRVTAAAAIGQLAQLESQLRFVLNHVRHTDPRLVRLAPTMTDAIERTRQLSNRLMHVLSIGQQLDEVDR